MKQWHTLSPVETAAELDTDLASGLTSAEAGNRLVHYGPNALSEPTAVSPWQIFFNQFKSVMTLLLLAAAAIALLIGDQLEAGAILVVLLLNALLGFFNEYRAERSVQALKGLVVPLAEVIRDGKTDEIPAAELVPGDLIALEAGDRVPADARLVESWSLHLDESALTGESVAADKDRDAVLAADTLLAERQTMVYMGTAVLKGRGRAIITATGQETEVGKISLLLETAEQEPTPLEARLDRLGRYLVLAVLVIAALVALAGWWRGQALLPMLETSLALAIAAVPEGLPAVVTIALALGMRRMAGRKAIVRRLAAVETLGSTNVICTDKTGTLTQNQMTVREFYLADHTIQVSGVGYEPQGAFTVEDEQLDPLANPHLRLALQTGLLCNTATLEREDGRWQIVGDPTEGALLVTAIKAGFDVETEEAAYPKVEESPFDARERRMATVHTRPDRPGQYLTFVKGAPEAVLPACPRRQRGEMCAELTEAERERLWSINTEMAGRALRVLALAYKETSGPDADPFAGLTFLGFVGMIDPPRPEAQTAVAQCQAAGIRVVMITGDQKTTAQAIAQELGMVEKAGQPVLDGRALDGLDEAALQEQVRETAVYARVSPEHKLRIVRALQKQGQVVAMTGDGVNDAPALKAADIGVAMGKMGTDVAREAADMVLADDNFATIVAAVEEGRVVFANVRKFVHYLFSCNLSEILTMFLATIAGLPLPLLPLQILWLNLVTDVFPALALAGESAEPGIMQRRPVDGRRQRPPASFGRSVLIQGALLAAASLAAFYWAWQSTGDTRQATTVAFLSLGLGQLFHVFNSRFETGSIFSRRILSNRAVWGAIGLTIVLQGATVYLPGLQALLKTTAPSVQEWGVIWLSALTPTLVIEIYKVVRNQ